MATDERPNHCGSCTACCRVYAIPELSKPAGEWCDRCAIGKGCKAYDTRPTMCAEFQCMWLEMKNRGNQIADELRPDRCKVVFSPTMKSLFSATTMPGAPDAWRKPAVRNLIDLMIKNGLRVLIGPPASTRKIMLDKFGERDVEMTPPDENGTQWPRTG